MKNVLVLIHDDAGQDARLQAALDLTRAMNGHLTCLDVSIIPIFAGDYISTGGEALLLADEQHAEEANRARLLPRLEQEDVSFEWLDVCGELATSLRDASRMADVIVVNRALEGTGFPDMRDTAAELVVKSGKPILAVPQDIKRFNAYGHALVAWDGSRGAEAAMRAAMPLLQRAGTVTVFSVDDGSIKVPAIEAAEYLSRHGIKPIVRQEGRGIDSPSVCLLTELRVGRIDYLVMGGFGHSRFVESMIGGVSKRMLTESPVPVFMAH